MGLLMTGLSMPSYACLSMFEESVVIEKPKFFLCQEISTSVETLVGEFVELLNRNETYSPIDNDYWNEWALKGDEQPLLTQRLSDNALGLGLWQPEEYAEIDDMTYREWFDSHGVLLSLGFGDRQSGHPRMRIDYHWHNEHEDNVNVLIEIPIQ